MHQAQLHSCRLKGGAAIVQILTTLMQPTFMCVCYGCSRMVNVGHNKLFRIGRPWLTNKIILGNLGRIT